MFFWNWKGGVVFFLKMIYTPRPQIDASAKELGLCAEERSSCGSAMGDERVTLPRGAPAPKGGRQICLRESISRSKRCVDRRGVYRAARKWVFAVDKPSTRAASNDWEFYESRWVFGSAL